MGEEAQTSIKKRNGFRVVVTVKASLRQASADDGAAKS